MCRKGFCEDAAGIPCNGTATRTLEAITNGRLMLSFVLGMVVILGHPLQG